MYIYNVTTLVQHQIQEAWLEWLYQTHIPDMLQTGCFTQCQVTRLLETDETEGITYAIQYYIESKALYNRYIELYAPAFKLAIWEKWNDRTIDFSSLMEIVN